MTLLDEAKGFAKRPGGTCGVATLDLSQAEQAELDEALESRVSGRAIVAALQHRGHDIPYHTLNRHRKGECVCRRS